MTGIRLAVAATGLIVCVATSLSAKVLEYDCTYPKSYNASKNALEGGEEFRLQFKLDTVTNKAFLIGNGSTGKGPNWGAASPVWRVAERDTTTTTGIRTGIANWRKAVSPEEARLAVESYAASKVGGGGIWAIEAKDIHQVAGMPIYKPKRITAGQVKLGEGIMDGWGQMRGTTKIHPETWGTARREMGSMRIAFADVPSVKGSLIVVTTSHSVDFIVNTSATTPEDALEKNIELMGDTPLGELGKLRPEMSYAEWRGVVVFKQTGSVEAALKKQSMVRGVHELAQASDVLSNGMLTETYVATATAMVKQIEKEQSVDNATAILIFEKWVRRDISKFAASNPQDSMAEAAAMFAMEGKLPGLLDTWGQQMIMNPNKPAPSHKIKPAPTLEDLDVE